MSRGGTGNMRAHSYSLSPHLHIAFRMPQGHRILVDSQGGSSLRLKGSIR